MFPQVYENRLSQVNDDNIYFSPWLDDLSDQVKYTGKVGFISRNITLGERQYTVWFDNVFDTFISHKKMVMGMELLDSGEVRIKTVTITGLQDGPVPEGYDAPCVDDFSSYFAKIERTLVTD